VTALIVSILAIVVMVGIAVVVARRRPAGTPLTWGEGFAAALFVFTLMLVSYAIMPSQWLTYADNTLRWRPDKIGIPTGPLHYLPGWPQSHTTAAHKVHVLWMTLHAHSAGHGKVLFFIPTDKGVLWPNGVTFFARGKIVISAQILRDVIVTLIYVVALGGQLYGWSWWQKRGKRRVVTPELPTSAYGRPLVRKV
jgi:hypothetical protein